MPGLRRAPTVPPSPVELGAFFERQQSLIQQERDADVARTALLFSKCSPRLLEQRGLALGGLGVAGISLGLGGKSLVELERPAALHTSPKFPPHTFRPGDLGRIEVHTTTARKPAKPSTKKASGATREEGDPVEGVVYKVTETKITIAIDSDDTELPDRCRLLKLANTVTYDRMERALSALSVLVLPTPEAVPKLYQVLLGLAPPSRRDILADISFLDEGLNESQKRAVRACLEAKETALIHGPPGTGKTHTLIEIIRQLVKSDKRVLVCGASNLSVDNILLRLQAYPEIPVTRLGHPARVLPAILSSTLDSQTSHSDEAALANDVKKEIEEKMSILSGKGKDAGKGGKGGGRVRGEERRKMWGEVRDLRKEYHKRETGAVRTVLSRAKVVLSTCHGAGSRQLEKTLFDVVIIDEATQALEAVCWIPILKAQKVILAGDPLQLPPTVLALDSERRSTAKADPAKKADPSAMRDNSKLLDTTAGSKPEMLEIELPESDDTELSSGEEEGDGDGDDDDDAPPPASGPPGTGPTADEGSSLNSTAESLRAKPKPQCRLRLPKSLEVTLFDRIERMYPRTKRMLTVQYRMHEQICSFPSRTLYRSKLFSDPSVASHLLSDLPNVSSVAEQEVVRTPVVFIDTAGCEFYEKVDPEALGGRGIDEGSRVNENEGVIVSRWVRKLVAAGVLPSQIAVITPYQAQVTYLTTLLLEDMPELEIGTVDGMQGREKEAIVLSLVRSNEKREVGFLKEKRRLNVAMTRPRSHLCVVGDSETVSQGGPYLKSWMEWLENNADVQYGGDES